MEFTKYTVDQIRHRILFYGVYPHPGTDGAVVVDDFDTEFKKQIEFIQSPKK
jgi:hypothetical protein